MNREFVQEAFGHHLDPKVVEQLVEHPELIKLDGEERVMTAFFSDVASFSTISENLTPTGLVTLLNEYLTEMCDIIGHHGGTIDKFEGDMIIAFYGAPIPCEDHAERAALACVDMQAKLVELRRGWEERGEMVELRKKWADEGRGEFLRARMGVNTGRMVVGNMGSRTRVDYTIMGDAVNLASRLEEAGKQYNVVTMITHDTYERAEGVIEARQLDAIRVVGKEKPVKVYEILGRRGQVDPARAEAAALFARGYEMYTQQCWDEAIAYFEAALKAYPGDGPSPIFIKRCQAFKLNPPPANWDAVYTFEKGTPLQAANAELLAANKELQRKTEDLEKARDAAEQANRAKSIFLANMSHEIRTPMNAILGYAQILLRDSTLAPSHRKSIETIRRSGYHLLTLINDVLDISRIEAGRLELHPLDFDLQALVQGLDVMFRLHCEQKRLTWRVERPQADRIPVRADEAKLSQVLINLLGNAVKFTDEGGVTLRVTALSEGMAQAGSTGPITGQRPVPRPVRPGEPPRPPESRAEFPSLSEHFYLFEVIDTGPGISPDAQKAIFEPFHQEEAGVKKGGTGLGLTISQRVLGLMGGKLELDSTVGQGSRFFFTIALPSARAEISSVETDRWARVTRLKEGFRVKALVADDIPENREVLSRLLTNIGVEVTLAENGREALDMVRSHTLDIVFLDIRMPVMGGQEAARHIWQECGEDAPSVVAISASTLDHERREYIEAGFDGFLSKPFRAEQVYACLAEHLGVEFEYAEPVETVQEAPLDLKGISLPDDLLQRLRQAAEVSSVTELEQALDEAEKISPEAGQLAKHLRGLSQEFKMDEILGILEEISHG